MSPKTPFSRRNFLKATALTAARPTALLFRTRVEKPG
ncbi:twin-arginine translocation signal domain-containing protein [Larkinella harenae]